MAVKISIVYQDEDIVAIHKPAGALMHRSPKEPTCRETVLQMVRDYVGHHLYPVHRLDRATSGIVVFALSSEMARTVSQMFSNNTIEKYYLAIVRGYVQPFGMIDYPLTRDPLQKRQSYNLVPASTSYRCLATIELPHAVGRYTTSRYSLVAVSPKTGRMHQIRRHFHHISHPVIGDTIYGDGRHNQFFRKYFSCHRLLLAALELRFPHPRTTQSMRLIAPLSLDFVSIVQKSGWEGELPLEWLV